MQTFNFRAAKSEIDALLKEYEKAKNLTLSLPMSQEAKDEVLAAIDKDFSSKQKDVLLKWIEGTGKESPVVNADKETA